jgi:hypothetical protein
MAERTAERARETAGEKGLQAGQQGYEQLFALSQNTMESVLRMNRAMIEASRELGEIWLGFWQEQLTAGMEASRSFAACRSFEDALDRQNAFLQDSFERATERTSRSAEIITQSFRPLEELGQDTRERMREAA